MSLNKKKLFFLINSINIESALDNPYIGKKKDVLL